MTHGFGVIWMHPSISLLIKYSFLYPINLITDWKFQINAIGREIPVPIQNIVHFCCQIFIRLEFFDRPSDNWLLSISQISGSYEPPILTLEKGWCLATFYFGCGILPCLSHRALHLNILFVGICSNSKLPQKYSYQYISYNSKNTTQSDWRSFL